MLLCDMSHGLPGLRVGSEDSQMEKDEDLRHFCKQILLQGGITRRTSLYLKF